MGRFDDGRKTVRRRRPRHRACRREHWRWQASTAKETALTRKARGIHERVLTLDSHVDINVANFTADRNYTQDLGNKVNVPKMLKGVSTRRSCGVR